MYTLRILTETKSSDGKQSFETFNVSLGESYSIHDRYSKEGIEVLENSTDEAKANFRYLLIGEKGVMYRITKTEVDGIRKRYYVMTENGKTFESLNYE